MKRENDYYTKPTDRLNVLDEFDTELIIIALERKQIEEQLQATF